MSGAGQFCAVARSLDILGGRWTLLIIRELLCGSERFNDIRRGVPRISRTMLSERLQMLAHVGAIARTEGSSGPEYVLTSAGMELLGIIEELGLWGQRWLPRQAHAEDLDLEPLLIDMRRRVNFAALPNEPLVVRLEFDGHRPSYLLLRQTEASLCHHNPGYPELISLGGPLAVLVAWWRGDLGFREAQRSGLRLEGPRPLVHAFPSWFDRYMFANVEPAAGQDSVPLKLVKPA
ncbi:winged helix-turn-helix transcriptional regulator [Sphingomonas sp. URHD0057]|uniref:winged helix-turn-helix transcriptional regulator n=1 Tax=Sphingomonas sp. URHD0057 TaxID=1380389 RepID=UPI000687C245|nr:helix-turn-helix domain-containing protein [Sphingomonas sp. URHD0057]